MGGGGGLLSGVRMAFTAVVLGSRSAGRARREILFRNEALTIGHSCMSCEIHGAPALGDGFLGSWMPCLQNLQAVLRGSGVIDVGVVGVRLGGGS
eukprot:2019545-Pleurochrysis_carterae.AAC.5